MNKYLTQIWPSIEERSTKVGLALFTTGSGRILSLLDPMSDWQDFIMPLGLMGTGLLLMLIPDKINHIVVADAVVIPPASADKVTIVTPTVTGEIK